MYIAKVRLKVYAVAKSWKNGRTGWGVGTRCCKSWELLEVFDEEKVMIRTVIQEA